MVERVFWIQSSATDKDDMQFAYMVHKGTTDAIFMIRQLHEKYRVKRKKVYSGFVDLEKAFDRVPGEMISWAVLPQIHQDCELGQRDTAKPER